ncbi:MAG TPA: DUF2231 domain-containing protein [Geothrix sp.]|nr:DUF2231 domain-containing protein [Geothrix sp.]
MPSWNHLHPALVHFPVALLLVAPLLVVAGLTWPTQRRGLHTAALILLGLGFAGLVLALLSGEAVTRYARATADLQAGVRDHELAAQWTTLLFAGICPAFAALWALPLLRKRPLPRALDLGLMALWLLLAAAGALALARTAHAGGHLVHDLHTHAAPEPRVE